MSSVPFCASFVSSSLCLFWVSFTSLCSSSVLLSLSFPSLLSLFLFLIFRFYFTNLLQLLLLLLYFLSFLAHGVLIQTIRNSQVALFNPPVYLRGGCLRPRPDKPGYPSGPGSPRTPAVVRGGLCYEATCHIITNKKARALACATCHKHREGKGGITLSTECESVLHSAHSISSIQLPSAFCPLPSALCCQPHALYPTCLYSLPSSLYLLASCC